MKHIFIVNPAAGRESHYEEIKNRLAEIGSDIDYEIYVTKEPMDAAKYIKNYLGTHTERTRFYACGGDGTLNEVVNGVVGFDNAEVAAYPCGSGDDFVKYYGGASRFINIADSIEGETVKVDLLKIGDRYSVNVVHFGFDSYVAKMIPKIKRKRVIGGKRAYLSSVIYALVKGMKSKCTVYVDGEAINDKKMLLCTVANGAYVGGSYNCAPNSRNDDGIIDICLFKPVSKLTFVKLMKKYQTGKHLSDPACMKYMVYRQGKVVRCVSEEEDFCVSVDGEILYTNDFTVEVIPSAINFVVPKSKKPVKA